jgi:hypothetical protein
VTVAAAPKAAPKTAAASGRSSPTAGKAALRGEAALRGAAATKATKASVTTRLSDSKRGWVMRGTAEVIEQLRALIPKKLGLKLTRVSASDGGGGEELVDATIANKHREVAIKAATDADVEIIEADGGAGAIKKKKKSRKKGDGEGGGDGDGEPKKRKKRVKVAAEDKDESGGDGGQRAQQPHGQHSSPPGRRSSPTGGRSSPTGGRSSPTGGGGEDGDEKDGGKEAGEGGDDDDEDEEDGAEELEWVRKMRCLKIRRVWKMLKKCDVAVAAASKKRVGDDRRAVKLYLSGVVEAAQRSPPLLEAMRVWVAAHFDTKARKKAARKPAAP